MRTRMGGSSSTRGSAGVFTLIADALGQPETQASQETSDIAFFSAANISGSEAE